ncbi:MAG: isomerase [Deltaproteobacteria bacterium]|nr:MAG: isomerase [Deltaproteobacteria bacterium]
MEIQIFQVDAFTKHVFKGNPAAVCPLNEWLGDYILQKIAAENNLSETAFFVKKNDIYELRWFTPRTEVDLCGHATLAAAFVIFNFFEDSLHSVTFETMSGKLVVEKEETDLLFMDFPSRRGQPCDLPEELIRALGEEPAEVFLSRDYLVVYESENQIKRINPNMDLLEKLDSLGVIITAPGDEVDFVSRFFAPKVGVPEDPVTGSAHCTLIPYWSNRLKKKKLRAHQLSPRGGEIFCEDLGKRVRIGGYSVLYLKGVINTKAAKPQPK